MLELTMKKCATCSCYEHQHSDKSGCYGCGKCMTFVEVAAVATATREENSPTKYCLDRHVSGETTKFCYLPKGHGDHHIYAVTSHPFKQKPPMSGDFCAECEAPFYVHALQELEFKLENGKILNRRANDRQVGGQHYNKLGNFQVWDAWHYWNLNPFQAVVLKYIVRYKDKGGIEDLKKAIHYIEKLMELEYGNKAK